MAIPGTKRGRPKLEFTKPRSNAKFTSYISGIQKEIDKISSEKTRDASEYLVDKIRTKISGTTRSLPGRPPATSSGSLIKGVAYKKTSPTTALVGFVPPAQHAHLMEFGTKTRVNKSYIKINPISKKVRKKYTGRNLGKVDKRPFILPTFEEEKENIKKLMSTGWLE
jgi:hypothetical protein